jgi:hypothetical protein
MKRFGQLGEDGGFQGLGDNIGWSFLIEAQTRGLSPDPSTLLTQARVWNWPHGLATQGCQAVTPKIFPEELGRSAKTLLLDHFQFRVICTFTSPVWGMYLLSRMSLLEF